MTAPPTATPQPTAWALADVQRTVRALADHWHCWPGATSPAPAGSKRGRPRKGASKVVFVPRGGQGQTVHNLAHPGGMCEACGKVGGWAWILDLGCVSLVVAHRDRPCAGARRRCVWRSRHH
jgi:hypothetical protein